MTTLEVVDAVQRSLENEGLLQTIRAQLRANVLRIIASGPNYVPHAGKVVNFRQTEEGEISLHLVKDLLVHCGLRESLAVFEAETGLKTDSTSASVDRLCEKTGIVYSSNTCLLESLVHDALSNRRYEARSSQHMRAESKQESIASPERQETKATYSEPLSDQESVPDEQDEYAPDESFVRERDDKASSEEEEEEGEPYSAIDASADAVDQAEDSFAVSPAKPAAASPMASPVANPVASPAAKPAIISPPGSPVESPTTSLVERRAPQYALPGINAHTSRLDESSSFEAESPAKSVASQRPGRSTAPLEDSFAEEDEEHERDKDESDAEEVPEEDMEVPEEEDAGPEYDSEQEQPEAKSPGESPQPKKNGPGSDMSRSSSKESSRDEMEESQFKQNEALRPARAEDFDRVDRAGAFSSAEGTSSNRNRIAVRRAAAAAGEASGPGGGSAASRANVNRLGAGSVSRSQLGWGATDNDMRDFESSEDEGRDQSDKDASPAPRRAARNDMETESFEDSFDDAPRAVAAPARRAEREEPVRRSNNQEEEDDHKSASSRSRSGEQSGEENFEEEEVESGSDGEAEMYVPSGRAAVPTTAPTSTRAAFGSPQAAARDSSNNDHDSGGDSRGEEQQGDEEEEYADEDFDEDEQSEHEQSSEEPAPASVKKGLFAPSAAAGRATGLAVRRVEEEADEVESVEESIPDEEDDEDAMSVGADSDDSGDADFRHTAAGGRKPAPQQAQGGSMLRAGRSGVLPGVNKPSGGARGSNFDAVLNSFEDSGDEDEDAGKRAAPTSYNADITARMREIDSQLESMERRDAKGELAQLRRRQEEDGENSVASEDIDAMEFSTGGGHDDSSESSGEGSFSFLDSSSKK